MPKKLWSALLGLGLFLLPTQAAAISLRVTEADVRQVLMSAARLGDINLILDDSVQGSISLNIKEIAPADVLRLVAKAKNLSLTEGDGFFIVAGWAENLRELHAFPLSYAKPQVVREAVKMALAGIKPLSGDEDTTKKEQSAKNLNDTGRVFLDENTGTLLLYGTETEARLAKGIIEELDVKARQISLEAKVVALDKDAAKKLGIEWDWSKLPQYPKVERSYESRRRSVTAADGTATVIVEDVPTTEVTRSYNNGGAGIIQFGRGPEGYPFEMYYQATINALINHGQGKLLARPNITTLQGEEALISIGGQVPVPKVTSTNSATTTTIEYKPTGIILKCTPRVNEDGSLTVRVHTEVSSPLYVEEMKAYRFQERSADTTVRLKDGETMVIGGLIGSEEYRSQTKVPFLGDLPILGAFFRSIRNSKNDSEVMIFLTARVLE